MHNYNGVDNWTTSISLIDDSDPPNATNINSGPQGLRDNVVYLYNRIHQFYIPGTTRQLVQTDFQVTSNQPSTGTPSVNEHYVWSGFSNAWGSNFLFTASPLATLVGDLIEVDVMGTISNTLTSDSTIGCPRGWVRLEDIQNGGSSIAIPGASQAFSIDGAMWGFFGSTTTPPYTAVSTAPGGADYAYFPFHLKGVRVITTPGLYQAAINGFPFLSPNGSSKTGFCLIGDLTMSFKQYRTVT